MDRWRVRMEDGWTDGLEGEDMLMKGWMDGFVMDRWRIWKEEGRWGRRIERDTWMDGRKEGG